MLRQILLALITVAFALNPGTQCLAALANAWHIPDNASDLGFNMRSPEFEIGTNTTVTVYQGIQKWNNGTQIANQTGGTLYYKGLTQSTWSSTPLNWNSDGGANPNNQYWKASFNTAGVGAEEVIQYYIYITTDGYGNVGNTYVYGGDGGSTTTASQATAATSPFTIRNRPAWLFHDNNRVVNPGADGSHNNVDFWLKLGYIGKDGSLSSRWADNAIIYYTTDGSTPTGTFGSASSSTQVAMLALDHTEDDASPAGNAMWWKGTVTNLAVYTTIKYKISAWHSSASPEEKFADYGAGANNTVFSFSLGTSGDPVLTVNGLNADYTTTHLFVDELAGDSIPLTILFSPNASNVVTAEVFSNLNRRDRATQDANGDGIEDGIVAPDGNAIVAGDDSNYYKAYTMSPSGQPGQYTLTLNAQKAGAYRLTARYKVSGNPNWFWYSGNGRRDHALVVSPAKARNITLYELNALNVGSQGTQDYQRSTFTDLYNGPGSRPYDPVTNRFNLTYAQNLGVNWLWFQPIHPIGIDGRQTDGNGQPYSVGSPYSVKNFFQINPLLSKANTRGAALMEFTNFVAAADTAGINVMLDAAFNHTSWDCELDAKGIQYFAPAGNAGNWQATDEIRNREARFYSASGAYCSRASSAANVAPAPDRADFGKWNDVHDVFFGRYAALVCSNPSDNGNYLSEADWFDSTVTTGNFDTITQNVWKYFADYVLYWLDQTGCPAGTAANQSYHGIDGLRADFGQGLPPQCWEYIINKVRSRKWNFVFMSESLDGGVVTYRSNRHFDILNENIVFPLQSAANASDYRNIFEARRSAYGQSLVLLNTTSHDEQNYADPFEALIRYSACSAMDGAPMIFYGQELGISTTFGFDLYEQNFGKTIPHFKTFNSLQPIFAPANRNYGLDQLWPVYAAINQARGFSRALRSSNRYFLNQTGSGNPQPSIFSVAKYEQPNSSPNFYDVVFAFANLDRNNTQQGSFNVNITQNSGNLFGIKSGRLYNVKNIAAYTAIDPNRRNYWLWGPNGLTGDSLLNNGLYVSLNPVPGASSGWSSAPFEAQYLKLYDVTPPPTPAAPSTSKPYALSTNVTFSWPAVTDPDGGIAGYHVLVGTALAASNVYNAILPGTSLTVTNTYGQTLYARVSAVSNIGIEGAPSPSSPGTVLLDPGTIVLGASPAGASLTLTWPANLNTNFTTALSATNLTPPVLWLPVPGSPVLQNQQWQLSLPATNPARFYRLQLN